MRNRPRSIRGHTRRDSPKANGAGRGEGCRSTSVPRVQLRVEADDSARFRCDSHSLRTVLRTNAERVIRHLRKASQFKHLPARSGCRETAGHYRKGSLYGNVGASYTVMIQTLADTLSIVVRFSKLQHRLDASLLRVVAAGDCFIGSLEAVGPSPFVLS